MALDSSRRARVGAALRRETTGGMLLLAAAAAALVLANSPWRDGYAWMSEVVVGPPALGLDLSMSTWAADGLLAIFFFVVGVELKHEIVAGSLRRIREAAVPVLAAIGGMLVPAAAYAAIVVAADDAALPGWAIPTATDIAFALAILAVFGRGLPVPLRTFLLTLAVVDDLLAIVVIATFYTATIQLLALLAALAAIAVFAVLVRTRWGRWWTLLPVAAVAWWLMHESGVHATVAGVLLGATVPARPIRGERRARTVRYEHVVRPVATGFALPVFAFFAAGVHVAGEAVGELLAAPVLWAVVVGLLVGKVAGVLGVTALVTRLTPMRLPDGIGLRDLLPIGLLTGIGFTVSLLIAELSFPDGDLAEAAKVGILIGSAASALLAARELRRDARRARGRDMNDDGIPDSRWPRIGDPQG